LTKKSIKQEIQNAGIDKEFVNFPDVKHSFIKRLPDF
jgi:hypothetical protein